MTARDGKPCKKCGANDWTKWGCKPCKFISVRKCRAANPEKKRVADRRRRVANPEKQRASNRKWRAANLEKSRAFVRNWQAANPEKVCAIANIRRTRKTNAGGSFTAAEFRALCAQYDNRCLRCGRDGLRLTADHVMPVGMKGSSNIDNIQPLCGSCNSWKGMRHIDYRTKPGLERWSQPQLFTGVQA